MKAIKTVAVLAFAFGIGLSVSKPSHAVQAICAVDYECVQACLANNPGGETGTTAMAYCRKSCCYL